MGYNDDDSSFLADFKEYPWWLRWGVGLIPLIFSIIMLFYGKLYFWAWGIGGALFMFNLYLSMNDLLDILMPRRDHDE